MDGGAGRGGPPAPPFAVPLVARTGTGFEAGAYARSPIASASGPRGGLASCLPLLLGGRDGDGAQAQKGDEE